SVQFHCAMRLITRSSLLNAKKGEDIGCSNASFCHLFRSRLPCHCRQASRASRISSLVPCRSVKRTCSRVCAGSEKACSAVRISLVCLPVITLGTLPIIFLTFAFI